MNMHLRLVNLGNQINSLTERVNNLEKGALSMARQADSRLDALDDVVESILVGDDDDDDESDPTTRNGKAR